MSVSITRIADEPIMVAQVRDRLDISTVRSLFQETALFLADTPGTAYCVTDLLQADASIGDIARVLVASAKGGPGSMLDERAVYLMVAPRTRVRFIADVLQRKEFGGRTLPVFETVDDALAFARRACAPSERGVTSVV